jgi:hypothetical protein
MDNGPTVYLAARRAHIEAAAATESGPVKRPGGKLIGRLEAYWEPNPHRPGRRRLAGYVIVPDNRTRQQRRAQDRKEDSQ